MVRHVKAMMRIVILTRNRLFILQGAVTFAVAIAAAFILPDQPLTTRWLTIEERKLAQKRIARDTVCASAATSTFRGLLDAAKDPKLWLFAFMQHMHLAANGCECHSSDQAPLVTNVVCSQELLSHCSRGKPSPSAGCSRPALIDLRLWASIVPLRWF